MVDVSSKSASKRSATAFARIVIGQTAFDSVRNNENKKGDVLTVSKLAGIMAAKKTPDLIPLCHPLNLSCVDVRLKLNESRLSVDIECDASCFGETGVEMEALTGASLAALTVYDMCKAVSHDMTIERVRLLRKKGGKRDYET